MALFFIGLSSFAYQNKTVLQDDLVYQQKSGLGDGIYILCYEDGIVSIYTLWNSSPIYTADTGLGVGGHGCWKFTVRNGTIQHMVADTEDGYEDIVADGKDFDEALVPELVDRIKGQIRR
jgi:hypothetical protein